LTYFLDLKIITDKREELHISGQQGQGFYKVKSCHRSARLWRCDAVPFRGSNLRTVIFVGLIGACSPALHQTQCGASVATPALAGGAREERPAATFLGL
jgi:hypothetical protein